MISISGHVGEATHIVPSGRDQTYVAGIGRILA